MDGESREARRLTHGGSVDSRPAWSPDGRTIAFVRDTSRDTLIVLVDVASGRERVLIDTPTMDLDPVFAPDGRSVVYSSAEAGDFDLWRIDLASGAKTRLTTAKGQELSPQFVRDGRALVYVGKLDGSTDTIASLSLDGGAPRTLAWEGIASQLRLTGSPDGRSFAATVPDGDKWQLLLMGADGGVPTRIAADADYPLTPSWSRTGDIWFVQPGADERFLLYRVASTGGRAQEISPLSWNYGAPTARLTIRTRQQGRPVAVRLGVVDSQGHPALPETGISRFDEQHGRVFFHSPGVVTLEVPAGRITVIGAHGFDGVAEATRTLKAGEDATIDLALPSTGFDAAVRGWYSGDLHNHLNYGGPFHLAPESLVLAMRAENLDVATPEVANLHTVLTDQEFFGWQRSELPLIRFSQEVRSHFLGHVGVLDADALYSPSFYGPAYPVVGQIDVANDGALRFARAHGGLNVYVHPVVTHDPFPPNSTPGGLPLELVPDALAGDVDTLEIACIWSDELGTSDAWYRLLNLGLPINPSAGSDTMQNLYRTMAIGSTRVYAHPDGPLSMASFLDAVRKGHSFVSTGPMIQIDVGGAGPGGTIAADTREVAWTLDLWSATPVETAEVLVNGKVMWSGKALAAAGKRRFKGHIRLPAGGWVAARVYGGASAWPVQDSYPFAHSAPVWIGKVGSTEPEAKRAAAADLLRWMDVAIPRLNSGYPDGAAPLLKAHFERAREQLKELAALH